MRREYLFGQLDHMHLSKEPKEQFLIWLNEAEKCMLEPHAMALATADASGKPSSRMVLYKGWNERGLLFFTHYLSRKSQQLELNPHAAVTFYWDQMDRQVCLEGSIEKVSAEVSDRYFATRPRGSQLSSWASQQDTPLSSRASLEKSYLCFEEQYQNLPIPRPAYWGGYCLMPYRIEFWQGRLNRLHDRFLYQLEKTSWSLQRLSP